MSGSQPDPAATPLLEMRSVNAHYGAVHALIDVNLSIYQGDLVCLLGGNASGKSTTLKTLLGMLKPTSGEVVLDGEVVNDRPTSYRVARGVTMVPENRRLFKRLTVRENLDLGAYLRTNANEIAADMERVFELFPRVKERLNQKSGTAGLTIFMVEQNANMALSIADRGWVLQTGRVVLDDTAENLLAHPDLQASYLGTAEQ